MAKAKAATKSEIHKRIVEKTGLKKKDVDAVCQAIGEIVKAELGKKGPGVFAFPGLCKMIVKNKPATKAGTKPNPFKPGEMMEVKAKPATRVVKIRPLKALKEMVK